MSKKQKSVIAPRYKTLFLNGNEFSALDQDCSIKQTLHPGAYKFSYDGMSDRRLFKEFDPKSDQILELPSPEYTRVVNEMRQFLSPEIKKKFAETGFLYKRSALLHGLPGTGKTVIVTRVMRDVINAGGICIFAQDPRTVPLAFEVLNDLQPETLVLVVFEEIDGMIDHFGDGPFLSLLDGEIQKQNVMYLATTNFIETIPPRLLRPGRFASVIQVNYPNLAARDTYFNDKLGKLVNKNVLNELIRKTDGLSIDELKEVVQSYYIFGHEIDEVIFRIQCLKGNSEKSKASLDEVLEQLEEDEEYDEEASVRLSLPLEYSVKK